MPTTVRLVLAAVLVVTGLALVVVAALGGSGRLRRNRVAGVRTRASLHSGPAFETANRVAAPLLGAAGAVGLVGGAALTVVADAGTAWVLAVVGAIGSVVFAGLGGALGDRAAAVVVAAAPPPETCGGACAGCDLVAGCRPTSTAGAPLVSGTAAARGSARADGAPAEGAQAAPAGGTATGGEIAATSPASPDRP